MGTFVNSAPLKGLAYTVAVLNAWLLVTIVRGWGA